MNCTANSTVSLDSEDGSPPQLRGDLLKLHQLRMAVINHGSRIPNRRCSHELMVFDAMDPPGPEGNGNEGLTSECSNTSPATLRTAIALRFRFDKNGSWPITPRRRAGCSSAKPRASLLPGPGRLGDKKVGCRGASQEGYQKGNATKMCMVR